MPLKIVHFPHPTLRFQSQPIKRVDKQLRMFAAEMVELMYEHDGIGLAANQVDLPLRMFVVNPTGERGAKEEMFLLNPVISLPKGSDTSSEGCLSLPQVYGKVTRPESIKIEAFDMQGNKISQRADGLLAKVLQHENDHLDGVLFFDRMSAEEREDEDFADSLVELEEAFAKERGEGEIPDDAAIESRRQSLLEKYC